MQYVPFSAILARPVFPFFFFFNDTATTEIYTLSLHDALPISFGYPGQLSPSATRHNAHPWTSVESSPRMGIDRKSTRLNSSHQIISYAVFCLKKKKLTGQRGLTRTHYCPHACVRRRITD